MMSLFFLIKPCSGIATSPQTSGPSTKYSFTGTHFSIEGTNTFPTSSYYGTSINSINPLVYTLPLSRTMPSNSYKVTATIQHIYASLLGGKFHFIMAFNSRT